MTAGVALTSDNPVGVFFFLFFLLRDLSNLRLTSQAHDEHSSR